MKRTGFTKRECLQRAENARRQLKTMNELNSSQEERDLTLSAVWVWEERALKAGNGTWSHEYESLSD